MLMKEKVENLYSVMSPFVYIDPFTGRCIDTYDIYDNNGYRLLSNIDRDIRFAGMIKDGKTIYKRTKKGGYIGLDIEQYNKEECELEYEIEGYYPCYYIEEDDNKKKGYTCFECNTKIEEELAKEILGE